MTNNERLIACRRKANNRRRNLSHKPKRLVINGNIHRAEVVNRRALRPSAPALSPHEAPGIVAKVRAAARCHCVRGVVIIAARRE